jgi:hypothetical protein
LINAPISLTSEEKDSLFNLLNRIDQNEFYEPEVKGCSLFINQLSKEEALYVICYLLLNLNEKVELHLDRLLKYYDYILCGRGRIRKFFLLNDFNHLSGISVLMDVRDEFHSNLTEFLKDKLDGNNVIDEVSKFKKEFLPPSLKIKIINKIIEYMEKYTEEFNLRTDGFYEIYKFAYESAKEVGDEYYIGYYNYKIAKITKIIFRSNEEEDEDS